MIPVTCPECKTTYDVSPSKCTSCSYPFEIGGEDRTKVIAQQIMQKRALREGKSAAKTVRILFWILSALGIIIATIWLSSKGWDASAVLIFAIVLVGLSFLTYIAPLIATSIALLYYNIFIRDISFTTGCPISYCLRNNSESSSIKHSYIWICEMLKRVFYKNKDKKD